MKKKSVVGSKKKNDLRFFNKNYCILRFELMYIK